MKRQKQWLGSILKRIRRGLIDNPATPNKEISHEYGIKDLGYVTLPVADRLTENLRVKQDNGVCVIAGVDTAADSALCLIPHLMIRAQPFALYNKRFS